MRCRAALVASVFISLLAPSLALAATLSLSPSVSSVAAGDIITLTAVVNAQGVAVNNSEAVVQFPTDLLQVVSVSKGASVFNIWVEEPTFSNVAGRVSFNGGITNPGYSGSAGQVVSVTFRARRAGTASVLISDATVRANDGLGTNVLTAKSGSTISILSAAPEEPVTPAPTSGKSRPAITSPTHPDQDVWYSRADAVFQWKPSAGVTTVQTGIDSDPSGAPRVAYSPAISKKEVNGLADGVSYFHARYFEGGVWSPVGHYRVQIDTTPPRDLSIHTAVGPEGRLILRMNAADDGSGIARYRVQVDDGKLETVIPSGVTGAASTTLSALGGGRHTVVVQVLDRAGNQLEAKREVSSGVPSAINLIEYPRSLKTGEALSLKGQTSYPRSSVRVSFATEARGLQAVKVVADDSGTFSFESDPIKDPGIVTVWAELLNSEGDSIAVTETLSISVRKPILIQIGEYSIGLFSVLIPALALLFVFMGMLFFFWRRFFSLQARIRRDLEQLKARSHESFKKLSEEMGDELKALERGRGKSEAEKKLLEDLRDAVGSIDKYIQKMIQKIEDIDL
jgi:hypothetical protein